MKGDMKSNRNGRWKRSLLLISIPVLLLLYLSTTDDGHLLNRFSLSSTQSTPTTPTGGDVGNGIFDNLKEKDKLKCEGLKERAGALKGFSEGRERNERFVQGTKDVIIFNATVWTGIESRRLLTKASLRLSKGIISSIYYEEQDVTIDRFSFENVTYVDAGGRFLTPTLFDLHSHFGVGPSPSLSGAEDSNSMVGPIRPFLRSIDGFNTHDLARHRIVAGGVGSSLVFPGSADSMGGEAFVFKMRKVKGNSPGEMVVEPPKSLVDVRSGCEDGDEEDGRERRRPWRYLKMAMGENPSRVYGLTRMDSSWNMRSTFQAAKEIKDKQDEFCERLEIGEVGNEERFPEELEYDALVDLLRGRVKLNVHCYESTDFDTMIRHSNEFKFPIAAFHHAHEAYLVPDRIKETYGGVPAIAMFATFYRYKKEAYLGSEYASIVLNNHDIPVVFKSDHGQFLDARALLYDAALAHHFGLPEDVALRSVITTPAEYAGMGHRLGKIKLGYDADIVLWDSHPLSLGATPKQVWIDGIPQIEISYPTRSKEEEENVNVTCPKSASFDPPIDDDGEGEPKLKSTREGILLYNFVSLFRRLSNGEIREEWINPNHRDSSDSNQTVMIVKDGKATLKMISSNFLKEGREKNLKLIDLRGGSILPSATTFGTQMGLADIAMEDSTTDGLLYDPLTAVSRGSDLKEQLSFDLPIKAKDGISWGGKDMLTAISEGITKSVTVPQGGFFSGISTHIRLGAEHGLEKGAFIQREVALHFNIDHFEGTSISTQIGILRELLLSREKGYFTQAAHGNIPLVITAEKADVMAALLRLKKEVETKIDGKPIKMIFSGASESHIIADEIAAANVSIILTTPRCIPSSWDTRRCLDGPPLTPTSLPVLLTLKNITVAFGGSMWNWKSRHQFYEASWALKTSAGRISREQAIEWATGNLERMLGLEFKDVVGEGADFVAFEGNPFEFDGRPRVVADGSGKVFLL